MLQPVPQHSPHRSGFTLLEVLLVVALMAIAASLFVVSLETMARSSPQEELEAAFWSAMAKAREKALTSRRPVELSVDAKERQFVLTAVTPFATVDFPAQAKEESAGAEVVFTEELPSNDFVLVRGALVTRRPVAGVKVFPDGSCQAFAVEFRWGRDTRQILIDPWSAAEMKAEPAHGGGGRS